MQLLRLVCRKTPDSSAVPAESPPVVRQPLWIALVIRQDCLKKHWMWDTDDIHVIQPGYCSGIRYMIILDHSVT